MQFQYLIGGSDKISYHYNITIMATVVSSNILPMSAVVSFVLQIFSCLFFITIVKIELQKNVPWSLFVSIVYIYNCCHK